MPFFLLKKKPLSSQIHQQISWLATDVEKDDRQIRSADSVGPKHQ